MWSLGGQAPGHDVTEPDPSSVRNACRYLVASDLCVNPRGARIRSATRFTAYLCPP